MANERQEERLASRFNNNRLNRIHLHSWSEIIGKLQDIDERYAYIRVDKRIIPVDFRGNELLDGFARIAIGTKIGILRTDLPEKPLLVRILSQ